MSTTRVFDRDRLTGFREDPSKIAQRRAARFESMSDRTKFLDAFTQGRIAELRGDERRYGWYRESLEADDSVRVAGLIEGMASVPQTGRKRLSWKP